MKKREFQAAILELKERTGSSVAALTKYIKANNKDVDFKAHLLRAALKAGVESEKLVKVKASYKLSADAKKAAKKPAAKTSIPASKPAALLSTTASKPAALPGTTGRLQDSAKTAVPPSIPSSNLAAALWPARSAP